MYISMINRLQLLTLVLLLLFIFPETNMKANGTDSSGTSLFDQPIEMLIAQEVSIATKSTQNINKTPSVVSVITAEEIKIMGYRELEEVLQTIPGFSMTQIRLGVIPPAVRGVSNIRQGGRFLVLLDGIPYNDVMYGASFFFGGTFNLDAVERIEVIRGPGSALYGRNGFSCVINIITKQAKRNEIELGASYGSYNTYDIRGAYSLKKSDLDARIDAKYHNSDRTNSTYNNGEGGESRWGLGNTNLYLNGNINYKDFSFFASYAERSDRNSPAAGDFLTQGQSDFKIATYNLTYKKEISSNLGVNLKLYGRNEYRIQDVELATPNTTDTLFIPSLGIWIPYNAIYPEGAYADPDFYAYNYGFEGEINLQPMKNNRLLAGIQTNFYGIYGASVRSNYDLNSNAPIMYIDSDGNPKQYVKANMPTYEPGWIQNGGHSYQNLGLYAQDEHDLLDNLSIIIGGRLDYDSEAGVILNPRAGIVWEPSKISSVKLLYGKAYRAPTTNEQYKIMGFDKGNENLNPERIHTGELAIGLNKNKLFTQFSIYYNQLNDIINQLNINDSSSVKSYFNHGENTSYGFEVEAKYAINSYIYSFGNYSYTHSINSNNENTGSQIPHPNISKHLLNFGFNTRIKNIINWSVLLRYVGPIEKFRNYNSENEFEFISQDVVGNFVMLNSTLLISGLIDNFDISFQGYNLLDSKYYFQDDRYPHQPTQPGRHFLVRVNYNFNL